MIVSLNKNFNVPVDLPKLVLEYSNSDITKLESYAFEPFHEFHLEANLVYRNLGGFNALEAPKVRIDLINGFDYFQRLTKHVIAHYTNDSTVDEERIRVSLYITGVADVTENGQLFNIASSTGDVPFDAIANNIAAEALAIQGLITKHYDSFVESAFDEYSTAEDFAGVPLVPEIVDESPEIKLPVIGDDSNALKRVPGFIVTIGLGFLVSAISGASKGLALSLKYKNFAATEANFVQSFKKLSDINFSVFAEALKLGVFTLSDNDRFSTFGTDCKAAGLNGTHIFKLSSTMRMIPRLAFVDEDPNVLSDVAEVIGDSLLLGASATYAMNKVKGSRRKKINASAAV